MIRRVTGWWAGVLALGLLLVACPPVWAPEADAETPPAEEGTSWETLSSGEVMAMVRELTGDDTEVQEARKVVAAYIQAVYLKDTTAVQSVCCGDWKGFAQCLVGDLTPEARVAWVEGIVSGYAGTSASLREIKAEDVRELAGAVAILGASSATRNALIDRIQGAFGGSAAASTSFDDLWAAGDALSCLGCPTAYEIFIPYVKESAEWRSFGPEKLNSLVGWLNSLGTEADESRRLVAEHVVANWLGDAETVRSVGLNVWANLARVGRELPPEARQAWVQAVEEAFAPDTAVLLERGAQDVLNLVAALEPLKGESAAQLAITWITKSPLVAETDREDLCRVAERALACPKVPREERETVPQMLEQRFGLKPDQTTHYADCMLMVQQWSVVDDLEKVRQWTMAAYQIALGSAEARGTVSMGTLEELAGWLYHGQVVGQGKGYPALAEALARHAREGTLELHGPIDELAATLGTPETRQMLRAELLDAEGMPRLAAARVLAWAYRQAGEFEAWRTFVDGQIASASSPDAKAFWLASYAYTDPLIPAQPNFLRSLRWLRQAFAAAESEKARWVLLHELIRFYEERGVWGEAATLVESVKGQFGTEGAASLTVLSAQFRKNEVAVKEAAAQEEARVKRALAETQLDYCRKCLAEAQAKGDSASVENLTKAIEALEKELGY